METYNIVYVERSGEFRELDGTEIWLMNKQKAWAEHEFLVKSGDIERQLKKERKPSNGKYLRNFFD